jgi:hypothetical protein
VTQRQQVHRRLYHQAPRRGRHRGRVDQPVEALTTLERNVVADEHPVDPGRLHPGGELPQARRPAGQLVRHPQSHGDLRTAGRVSHGPFGMKIFSSERAVVRAAGNLRLPPATAPFQVTRHSVII